MEVECEHLLKERIEFCSSFVKDPGNRYVFGCNAWAKSIAEYVPIDAFIDDFTTDKTFSGRPIIKSKQIPKDARVVSAVVLGRPITVQRKLNRMGIACIDYFNFKRISKLPIKDVLFMDSFSEEYLSNEAFYRSLRTLLADMRSKTTLDDIINFRMSQNLDYMKGYLNSEWRQYFEPFLGLKSAGERFADVGSYDGYTSQQFINRFPDFECIDIFEPLPGNMKEIKKRLKKFSNINFHTFGASNKMTRLSFRSSGSSSSVHAYGDIDILVKPIDTSLAKPPTFIKMDIEGSELYAIEGAKRTIVEHHPKLAISVYHKVDDLRKIPELIMSYREDYSIYIRHYTEGITETVMFFIPKFH